MNRNKLLELAKDSETRLFLARTLDKVQYCILHHQPSFTDFLDPQKGGFFYEQLSKLQEVRCVSFGGRVESERRMIGFSPEYMELEESDFPIDVVKITLDTRFSKQLSHRDYLGSILSLGIERGKVGDIFLRDDGAYCYAVKEIAQYISINLTQVSKNKVKTQILMQQAEDSSFLNDGQDISVTAASTRLDAVIGSIFHLSRTKAQALIEGEKVNVNWNCVTKTSGLIKQSDMLSVRGYGRIKILEIGGKTKKDRTVIRALLYK